MKKSPQRLALAVTLALILALTTCSPGWFAAAEISDVDPVIPVVGDSKSGIEEPAQDTQTPASPADDDTSGGGEGTSPSDTDLSLFISETDLGLFLVVDGALTPLDGATFTWGVKRDAALALRVTGTVDTDAVYTYALPHGLTGKTDGWHIGEMLQYELQDRFLSVRFDEGIADALPLDVSIALSLKLDPDELVPGATWAKFPIAVSDGFRMVEISIEALAPGSEGDEPAPALDPEPEISPEPQINPEPLPDPEEPTESGLLPIDPEPKPDQGLQNQTEVGSEGDELEGTLPPEGDDDIIDDPVPTDDEYVDPIKEPAADPEADDPDGEDEEGTEPSDEPKEAPEDDIEEDPQDTAEETESLPERSVDVERIIAPILADGDTFELVAHLTGFEGVEPSFLWQYSEDGENWIDVEHSDTARLTVVAYGGNTLYHWRVLVSAPIIEVAPPEDIPDQPADTSIGPVAPID